MCVSHSFFVSIFWPYFNRLDYLLQSSETNGHQPNCGSSSSNSAQAKQLSSGAHHRNVKSIISCKSRSQTPEHIPVWAYKTRWGIAQGLRLVGGGETATATSGWNNNNSNSTAAYGQANSTSAPPGQTTQWNNNNANSQQPPRPTGNSSPQQPPASGQYLTQYTWPYLVIQ